MTGVVGDTALSIKRCPFLVLVCGYWFWGRKHFVLRSPQSGQRTRRAFTNQWITYIMAVYNGRLIHLSVGLRRIGICFKVRLRVVSQVFTGTRLWRREKTREQRVKNDKQVQRCNPRSWKLHVVNSPRWKNFDLPTKRHGKTNPKLVYESRGWKHWISNFPSSSANKLPLVVANERSANWNHRCFQ